MPGPNTDLLDLLEDIILFSEKTQLLALYGSKTGFDLFKLEPDLIASGILGRDPTTATDPEKK